MNTKKFIKKVDDLYGYECEYMPTDLNIFNIYNYGKRIEVNTLTEYINLDEYVFDSNDEDDLCFLKLILKYSKSRNCWNYPRKEWFKK